MQSLQGPRRGRAGDLYPRGEKKGNTEAISSQLSSSENKKQTLNGSWSISSLRYLYVCDGTDNNVRAPV